MIDAASDNEPGRLSAQIRKGSKTFALASLFFRDEQKIGAWRLYSWCRFVDDEIDFAPDTDGARRKLRALRTETEAAFRHCPSVREPMHDLAQLSQSVGLPSRYAIDLLDGMDMDVRNCRYHDIEELLRYCYCVAGTVGLMMCHVMGVSSRRAPAYAVSLGLAMQLTNIARDLKEDYERGRFYLPLDWCREEGLVIERALDLDQRAALRRVTERVLAEAEFFYDRGLEGLRYLPGRSAWAVAVAARFYREIGRRWLRAGDAAVDFRQVVPLWKKALLTVSASFSLARLRWSRRRQWKPVELTNLFQFEPAKVRNS